MRRTQKMARIPLIFVAEKFDDLCVVNSVPCALHSESSAIGAGVIESHFQIEMAEVSAADTFANSELLGMGMPLNIEPGFLVETIRFVNESIPFPVAYGVPHPSRIWIL